MEVNFPRRVETRSETKEIRLYRRAKQKGEKMGIEVRQGKSRRRKSEGRKVRERDEKPEKKL